jgi:RNA-directed DNA polymerase
MIKLRWGGGVLEGEYKKGLPIGNLTSQIFANIYLNELDQFIKHDLRIKHYFRYADDFAIVHTDPLYLQKIQNSIAIFLDTKLCLELHPDKVEIKKFSHIISCFVQRPKKEC